MVIAFLGDETRCFRRGLPRRSRRSRRVGGRGAFPGRRRRRGQPGDLGPRPFRKRVPGMFFDQPSVRGQGLGHVVLPSMGVGEGEQGPGRRRSVGIVAQDVLETFAGGPVALLPQVELAHVQLALGQVDTGFLQLLAGVPNVLGFGMVLDDGLEVSPCLPDLDQVAVHPGELVHVDPAELVLDVVRMPARGLEGQVVLVGLFGLDILPVQVIGLGDLQLRGLGFLAERMLVPQLLEERDGARIPPPLEVVHAVLVQVGRGGVGVGQGVVPEPLLDRSGDVPRLREPRGLDAGPHAAAQDQHGHESAEHRFQAVSFMHGSGFHGAFADAWNLPRPPHALQLRREPVSPPKESGPRWSPRGSGPGPR